MMKRREKYLKPLKGECFPFRFATFDIETEDLSKSLDSFRTKFEMAGVFDGKNYYQADSLPDLISLLTSNEFRGRSIYAHNGGRFDFLVLIPELIRQNKKFKLLAQGARIVEVKIQSGKNVTRLRDSYSLLPFSLAKLCEKFNPTRAKISGAIDFHKERVSKLNSSHRKYLEYDCRSLYEILEIYSRLPFVEKTGPKLTRSSTALAGWRTTIKEPIRITPDYVQAFCRKALAGGRTEIFKVTQNGGACFDKNSLYPSCMLKPLPLEFISETRNPEDFGYHEVSVYVPPETYIPVLWRKSPKLIFPTGYFRGVYFSEEIKLAVEMGARIIKHYRGMKFSSSDDLFREFIETNYDLRLKNPKGPINIIAKDMMNHCYGKTSEKEIKKSLQRLDPLDPKSWPEKFTRWHSKEFFERWGLVTVEKEKRAPHMLVHIGAAVVAWGRITMYRDVYKPYSEYLHYTDTDSGYLTCKAPVSNGLGELKEEYPVKLGFFLLPKCYYIDTGTPFDPNNPEKTGIIRKIKGFPRKALEQLTFDDFKNRNLKYQKRGLLTLRESLIRNNEFLSEGGRLKEIKAVYDKRKTFPDGSTLPWEINRRGKIING